MAVPQIPTKCTERICENIRSILGCDRNVKREKSSPRVPIALTIAGSDSGGGAGVQADLKTFTALNVHGVTALTCITAQNPRRVLGISPCSAFVVGDQLTAVFEELAPAAAKTGMLYSAAIIRAVAGFLRGRRIQVVVDPVMVSSSGARLLAPAAIKSLCRELLPIATLMTPNLHEAEVLLGKNLRSIDDLRRAAKELHRLFGTAVLVKGGHLKGINQAVDIFHDGKMELLLSAPFVRGIRTHGTGCTYSAAITACLAKGHSLSESVSIGKEFVTQAIARSLQVRSHNVLNYLWNRAC